MADTVKGPDEIRRVAVVGAGLIGSGWVAAFLAGGREVVVYDPAPEAAGRLNARLQAAWSSLVELGRVTGEAPAVPVHADLERALEGSDFVQENTPEDLEAKRLLYARLDQGLPADVMIASSTSNFAVSDLQVGCRFPGRCVLGHPFNPVHLMPLVEVGGGASTHPDAVTAARAFYAALGKTPIVLKREHLGHIANRLTAAMFREAVSLVAEGYAEVDDVDRALRYGPALKWAIQGQFTTFHTSGGEGGLEAFLEHFGRGMAGRWATMSTPDLSDPDLRARLVEQMERAAGGRSVSEISAEQDAGLLALLKVLAPE